MNFTHLSQLDSSGLDRLAALHQSVMHTLLSDLGLAVVQHYYQVCQQDSAVVGLCAISTTGEFTGWAVGSPHPDAINAQLRQPLAWFANQMLRLAVTRPGILLQLSQSVLAASDANTLRPDQIELTYIGVTESARGQGVGKALLSAFVEACRAAGYHSMALSVETDNPAAIALYTGAGFKVTKTFREGRFERHRMELAF
jgi:ribosomal protein S18 acetylase RimI-like enzyme